MRAPACQAGRRPSARGRCDARWRRRPRARPTPVPRQRPAARGARARRDDGPRDAGSVHRGRPAGWFLRACDLGRAQAPATSSEPGRCRRARRRARRRVLTTQCNHTTGRPTGRASSPARLVPAVPGQAPSRRTSHSAATSCSRPRSRCAMTTRRRRWGSTGWVSASCASPGFEGRGSRAPAGAGAQSLSAREPCSRPPRRPWRATTRRNSGACRASGTRGPKRARESRWARDR